MSDGQMTSDQLDALSPLDKAIVVASNLSPDRPWEIAQRRLDILGYLRIARAAARDIPDGER